MNLITLQKKYNTRMKCIRHLEKVRWGKKPACPLCEADSVTKRRGRESIKWHCNKCNRDFTVLKDTIFEASKMPLPKWFLLIALMLNARKGISSLQLSRDLGVTYKTAWYSAMRVRCAMVDETPMLEGIVEMDEAYIGGKPRKRSNKTDISTIKPKRGRGTRKTAVVGIVEREGGKRVVTEVADHLTSKNMLAMLRRYVNTEKAIMMTDEARFYIKFEEVIQHLVIKHKERYADGIIHTNTIEGFWSIVKNGIRGEYHVLSKKYLPFYLAEFAYKYNSRNRKKEIFDETIEKAVEDEKCLVNYKPKKKDVREITYGRKFRKNDPKKSKHKLKRKPKKKVKA